MAALVGAKRRRRLDRRLVKALHQLSRLLLFFLQSTMSANAILGRWPSLEAIKSRFPGCCANFGSFDCGDGVCLSVSHFHDGIADCSDGSDEHCFPEQISCGSFCADLLHLGECLRNPNCTESTETNHLQAPVPSPFCPFRKRRLCGLANTVSCRGYGQCILEKWLKDGKRDCLDGSDEDEQYANLFQFADRRTPPPASSNLVSTSVTLSPPFPLFSSPPRPFLTSSATTPTILWPILKAEGSKGGTSSPAAISKGEAKENPALNDFGAEFARFLMTPSKMSFPSVTPTSVATPLFGAVFGEEKSVDRWIIFPNWPTSATPEGIPTREWPKGKAPILNGWTATAIKEEENVRWSWMAGTGSSTPKNPFGDEKEGRGGGVEDVQQTNEESQRWTLPFPFQRPGKAELEWTTKAQVWEPEGKVALDGAETAKAIGTQPDGGKRAKGAAATGGTAAPEAAEKSSQRPPLTQRTWTTSTSQLWAASSTAPRAKPSPSSPSRRPFASLTLVTSSPSSIQSFSSPAHRWALPASSQSIAASSKKLIGLNCTARINRMAKELEESAVPFRCSCPPGQFQTSEGFCSFATVSTFRAKIVSLCGHNFADSFSSSAPSLQEQLIVLKLLDSLPDHSFCVRKIVNDGQIVVNTVSELTDGACHQFDLNDCDEKAQCLSDRMLFRCRCLPGTKDNSPEREGRQCEGTVILQTCSKLLGVCVIVWLLMLLLLCFLLPLLSIFCLKYCFKIDPTLLRVRLRHIWRNLINKLKGGEPTKLPTITTSQIADEMRRESLKVLPGTASRDEAVTLKVPSVSNGFGQQATIHSSHRLMPSDSEEYLIVEEGDTGGKELLKREQQQKEKEEGVEEEARLSDKQTARRQQTELSTVPSSSETGVIMLPTAREGSVQSADGTTTRSEEVVEQTTEVEVHEQVERVEEEKKGAEREAEELGRPKSAASRIGTPTIWDQYKILGDQFSKYGSLEIERRKGSVTESLEELLKKREKSVEERMEEAITQRGRVGQGGQREGRDGATKGEEELDANLGLSGKRREAEEREEQVMEEHEEETKQEGEPEEEQRETRKLILLKTLREGTLNIGFVMPPLPDGIGISRRPFFDDAGRLPPPKQHFPFKRRFFETNGGRLYGKAISQPILSKSPAVIREGTADFVVVKGRMGKEEDERLRKLRLLEERRQRWRRGEEARTMGRMREQPEDERKEGGGKRGDRSVTGQRRRAAFVRGGGGKEEAAQKRACQVTPPGAHQGLVRDERSAAKVRKMIMSQKSVPTPMFDPDLPSTSQAAAYWEKSLRRCFSPVGLQLEDYAKRRSDHFRKEGQTLRSIECQLEERVHSGCITSRKPWNISPQPDPDLPASPLFRWSREYIQDASLTPSHLDLGEPEHVDGMALGGAADIDSPKRRRKGRTVRIQEDVADDGGRRRRLGRGTEKGTNAGTWLEYD
uniref:Uncharacterized protein n=1 Tax=Globodera rostochiensis TaxID=31243 RepID=A0A914HWE5_GLORO